MAFKCGFFNSVNGDRKYNADDMCNPYSKIVSDGVFASPEGELSTDFQVQIHSGLQIKVKEGRGIFAGKWAILDSDMLFTVPTPNVTYPRIDSIVVRIDNSSNVRNGKIEYIQGTPAENPVAPTITRGAEIKDFRLANITVPANANAITTSNIADRRPYSECGIVTNLLQNSDISATFTQWQAQFDEWFDNLTKEASLTYSSVYTAETDGETTIPINISAFNSTLDILTVYINGLRLIPNIDYTLNDFNSITLTKGIDSGTIVSFFLLKNVSVDNVENVATEIQRINNVIPAAATSTNKLVDKAYVDSLVINGVSETDYQQQIDELEEKITEIESGSSSGGGSAANSVNFSYVVDSDQAFVDWVNNKSGNDYTSVLIRKGEWTATKGVNLTTTGTKVVVGEPGSKLKFTPTAGINCLAYNTTPTTSDYYMNGVYVEGVSVTVCFRNCANLTNCMGVGVTQGDGFIDCLNLTNCTAVAYGNVNGNAFNSCENLTNCKGTATGGNNGYGFQNCNNLTNCEGVGKGSYMPAGFRNCVSLTNCKGTGEGGTNGYGFQGCTLVSKCKAGGKSTIRVFDTSYASQAKTTAYACADTPEGGFNDPTNPTA